MENEKLITKTEVIFEIDNNGVQSNWNDPTTSLATSTMTHLTTLIGVFRIKDK